jgi:hypothetical protein
VTRLVAFAGNIKEEHFGVAGDTCLNIWESRDFGLAGWCNLITLVARK